MSVAGVGIATVIADGISAGLVMMFLIRNEDDYKEEVQKNIYKT